MKRAFHPPVFLFKHISLSAITFTALLYIFTTVEPTNALMVLLFLFLLFIFLSSFLSFVNCVSKHREDRRVWYLKEKNFVSLYSLFIFLSLGAVLMIFLSYIKQINYVSVGLVVASTLGGYILNKKSSAEI